LLFGIVGSTMGMTPVFWTMAAVLLLGGIYTSRGNAAHKT
jgi:hypothetical protein